MKSISFLLQLFALSANLAHLRAALPYRTWSRIGELTLPAGCPGVCSINHPQDIKNKRDFDGSTGKTHTSLLAPRKNFEPCRLCGSVVGGGQTDTFIFDDVQAMHLVWNFSGE